MREKNLFREMIGFSVYLLVVTLTCIAGWVFLSYLEARTYTRLTGNEISTFDAMFVNLRIIGEAADNGEQDNGEQERLGD